MNIKELVGALTERPGVYRMLDDAGKVIYVGKASNLRKRVGNYFRNRTDSPKTRALVEQIRSVEVTVTDSEGEALLLESNLIKELRPRYNVVFRDDKTYPYLYLSTDHKFPRLSFYRGARSGRGSYFGPFPGAGAARQALQVSQRIFRVRDCSESVFRNRSRPCLQYQIGRCTAPCVGYIDASSYSTDVHHMALFLQGRTNEAISTLLEPMQRASDVQDYERAARYRDQIASLRRIQEQQRVSGARVDCDVIACVENEGDVCVQLFPMRDGCLLGNRPYFPEHARDDSPGEIIRSFIAHQYISGTDCSRIPREIHVSHGPPEKRMLQSMLAKLRGGRVDIVVPKRGAGARWMRMALDNAALAISHRLESHTRRGRRLESLRKALGLAELPKRVECFDVSHTQGEGTVAACVVFESGAPLKSAYRRFNIDDVSGGDDFHALQNALRRRLSRTMRENGARPDAIFVDGGGPQVQAARSVLDELDLGAIPLIGIAKGPSRKPGMETLVISHGARRLRLSASSPALHLIQEIRDEAHRFAISGHRKRRAKRRTTSSLERIAGIGPRRRRDLLRHFGGLAGVSRAGVGELAKVRGIHKNLARKIYGALHGS